jgi:hypothetical protein
MPGYTLGTFFFRDDETPMGESTYEVRTPAPPEIDAHNIRLPPETLKREGDGFRFRYSARDVKPLQPEPHQVSESEVMPWVQLGTGSGQKELMRSLADWVLLRARPGSTTLELAKRSVGVNAADTARKIYAAVTQAVRGRSNAGEFQVSAAHVLAQGRGNRLLVLKAALASAQIPSHIVFARTFLSDQSPYRFPRGDVYAYAILKIDLPGGPAWVDPSYRLAPFNQIPAFLRGQDAWVVPEPGEETAYIRLPETLPDQRDGRTLQMDLSLDPEGLATGTGRDEHAGFEAASLKDALERLDRDQRKQAVESMLGHGLRGLVLDSLSTEHEAELGGPATLIYSLHAPYGRKDGDTLAVPASAAPSKLQRRWAAKAERALTLMVDSPEEETLRMGLTLPPGLHLRNAPLPVSLVTAFGKFRWSAREDKPGHVLLEESLSMPQQRVARAQYAAFAAFAAAVDEAQGQELTLAP